MAWTDESKAEVIKEYLDAKPTPETSTEIIQEIAAKFNQSPNGVRMILVTSGNYIKKDPTVTATKAKEGGASTRVSKEVQIKTLRDLITDNGAPVNDEILEKLTGKAADYFTSVLKSVLAED